MEHNKSRRDFVKLGAIGAGMLAVGNNPAFASSTLNAKDIKFDEGWDVVIIGSGFAGLAAAVKAAQRGNKVLVVEKMGRIGGNSVINGGALAVPNSPDQKKFNIEDSKELFIKDCLKAGLGINHLELLETIANRINDCFDFIIQCGAKFQTGKMPSWFGGHSVARTYITENMSGSGIIQPMIEFLEKFPDCKLMRRTKFDEFVLNDEGRVVGIVARTNYKFDNNALSDDMENTTGDKKFFKANKGVILASGGFAADKIYRKFQDPRLQYDQDTTNHAGATAGALIEALKIGAIPVHIGWIQQGPWTSPDEKGFGMAPPLTNQGLLKFGIAVDVRNGKRFMNELADRKTRADAEYVILHEDPKAYPVAIGTYNSFAPQIVSTVEKGLATGVMKQFDTIDELAKHYGIPADELKKTIEKYNKGVKEGVDEFNKPVKAFNGQCIEDKGPYYGVRLVPKPHHTMGGVKINEKAQVISANTAKPIPGLYAAGEVTGGTHGASRLGSVAIADCLTFGMIAGENI